jgi:predicted DCC family thiol-disulfide oxidoreductase YuxK
MGTVLALDREQRLRPVALQSPEAPGLLPGLDEEERMASFHLVGADGRRYSGGEALSRLMDFLAGGRALGAAMRRSPGATDRFYRLVADNRSRIGPLIPDAVKRRATAAIDRRS